MSVSPARRLRSLVNDYYHGLLTFDSYREQRRRLLDSLAGQAADEPGLTGELPQMTEYTQPRLKALPESALREAARAAAPTPRAAVAREAERRAPAVPPPPAAVPRARPRIVTMSTLGVLAAAIVVAGYGLLKMRELDESAVVDTPESAPAAAALPAGESLLDQFLRRNAWDADAVRNLEVTWANALGDVERAATRGSAVYRTFGDALRRRVRELDALGTAADSPERRALVSLATQLALPFAATLERAAPAADVAPAVPVPASPPVARAAQDADELAPDPPPVVAAEAVPAPVPAPAAVAPAVAASQQPAAAAVAAPTESSAAPGPSPEAAASATACSAALLATRRPYCNDTLPGGAAAPALALIPAGEFVMGSNEAGDEGPAHGVTIRAPLAIAINEVSYGEYRAFCAASGRACPDNPWPRDEFPVVDVSWHDAVAYADWLSGATGASYRLPSEAEWEYAARAGTTTRYPFGDEVTPSSARSSAAGAVDSPVPSDDRSVNRNTFRLLHMIGNVREWVADHWHDSYAGAPADGSAWLGADSAPRVVRGGAFSDPATKLRSAARTAVPADRKDRATGFRVVRELE